MNIKRAADGKNTTSRERATILQITAWDKRANKKQKTRIPERATKSEKT